MCRLFTEPGPCTYNKYIKTYVTIIYVHSIFFKSTSSSAVASRPIMPPQPLKVPSTPLRTAENDRDKTPVASSSAKLGTIAAKDISSPHELTAFVKF